jgi:predicted dehydrogenase
VTLRIGVLGAARIAPSALIAPALRTGGVVVAAVAARDPARARAFAAKRGIERVLDSYEALVRDSELDAIYNPLPNGLHARWTEQALAAGKHVLCEKPFAANATEARRVLASQRKAEAEAGRALVVMEAFHYRYHPLMARVLELGAELGPLVWVEANMCFPLPRFGDIRYQFDLAGGALMDAGCYALHFLRQFGQPPFSDGEPQVTDASAKTLGRDRRVDRAMTVDLRYAGGVTGRATASMWSGSVLNISARLVGQRGQVRVLNFVAPQFPHVLTSTIDGRRRRERVAGQASYTYQLQAFVDAINGKPTNLTPIEDSVATMELIDAAYTAAGLPIRAS